MSLSVSYPDYPIKSGDIFDIDITSDSDTLEIKDTEGLISIKPKIYVFPPGGQKKFTCKAYHPLNTKVYIKELPSGEEITFELKVSP